MNDNIQNTPKSNENKSTEIDLGELFRTIGRGINNLFIFLRNTFLFILDLLVRALIIIRVHIVKFVIVAVLSIIIGWFIDSRQPMVYGSKMIIQANFGSARQLYANVKYYNGLVNENDSTQLASVFGITPAEANNIKAIFIDPNTTEIELLKAYDEFRKETDSSNVARDIDFQRFKKSVDPLTFERHEIRVVSEQKDVFSKIQESIVTNNVENDYIKRQKIIVNRNLDTQKQSLEERLNKIDTLRNVYNRAIISEAKKTSNSQTSIQMASSSVKTSELELFDLDEKIGLELIDISELREFKQKTVNVLSDFTPGAEVKNFYDSYLFRIPLITLSILLLFILLRELNKYLNVYAENKRLDV